MKLNHSRKVTFAHFVARLQVFFDGRQAREQKFSNVSSDRPGHILT